MANGVRAGRAYIELGADSTALMRGLSKAQSALSRWGSKLAGIGAKITGAVSLGAMPAMLSTKVFADFDDAMRTVKAVTGATQGQFQSLTATAEKLGRETSFSAKQVAEGMAALGRMGFKPDQIEAAIPAVMDLSRATGTELAEAAEIAANNMNVFGMSADQMASVADILTATANGSAQTLTDLGESLKMAGPQGAAAGENIRTVAASLGILANMGLKGSMAGNALKKAYSQFAKTKIQDKLAQVGIRTTDESGDLRSMLDIMAEIGVAMNRMPSAERLAFAEQIFDMRGALAGLNLGAKADELRNFLDMLSNSNGTAHTQALEQDNGIGGTFRRMTSAAEGLAITFGRIVSDAIQPYAEGMAKAMTSLADWLGRHKAAILTAVKFLATVGAIGVSMVVLGKTLTAVSVAIGVVHTVLGGVAAAFSLFRAVVVGTSAAISFLHGISITFSGVMSAMSAAVAMAGSAFAGLQAAMAAVLAVNPITLLAAGLAALGAYAIYVGGLFDGLGGGLAASFGGAAGALRETIDAMKATIKSGDMAASWQVALAGVKLVFAEFMEGISSWWDKFCFTINETWEILGDNLCKAWNAVSGTISAIFYGIMSTVTMLMGKIRQAWNWIKAYTPGSGYSVDDARRDNAAIADESERTSQMYADRMAGAWNGIAEGNAQLDEAAAQRTMGDSRNAWSQMADEARAAMRKAVAGAAEAAEEKEEEAAANTEPKALKAMPQLPGQLESITNKAAGSFNARSFAGGGNVDWGVVKNISKSVEQIARNTENDSEEEVFA